jgi:hypothetical protein
MYTVSPVEWATPVLYLRADDARLFNITVTEPPATEAPASYPAVRASKTATSPPSPALSRAAFRISLIGPTRGGKTSLATVLLDESSDLLRGTGATMRLADRVTKARIASKRAELDSFVARQGGGITATMDSQIFRFELEPDAGGPAISAQLLDFSLGLLTDPHRGEIQPEERDSCREFVAESMILLIPINAALVMEAQEARHRRSVPRLLGLIEIEQVVRKWVAERGRLPGQPAMVAFCPVMCESYFADNGGTRDRSNELFGRVQRIYHHVVEIICNQAPETTLLYAPFDTLGCVEIVSAEWHVHEKQGEADFIANYLIRPPGQISRVGTADLLRAVCQRLIYAERIAGVEHAGELAVRAGQASRYANTREGLLRDTWLVVNGERATRAQAAQARTLAVEQARRRVAALDATLERVASLRCGPRVRFGL